MVQDQLQGRFAKNETVAQIALRSALEEQQILLPDRPVEPETADRRFDVCLVGIRADEHIDRIANDVHAEEDNHRHEKHDKERLHQPADDENRHEVFSELRKDRAAVVSGPENVDHSFTTPMARVYSSVRGMYFRPFLAAHVLTWKWVGMIATSSIAISVAVASRS